MKKPLLRVLSVLLLVCTLLTACAPVVTDTPTTPSTTPTEPTAPSETGVPTTPGHTHVWVAATCTAAKYCVFCSATMGEPAGHVYVSGVCVVCGDAKPTEATQPTTATDPAETDPPQATEPTQPHTHTDANADDTCDSCGQSVVVIIDFYALNDLHGKFCDTAAQPGVDELATYLKSRYETDDNVILFSSGDMWQGTAESNLTGGLILTDWMNAMGFVSMTLGNHEFDWGEEKIKNNFEAAEFPFLAINIYNKSTGKLAEYCTPSVIVERDGIQIGIIGAIGDCYSSISSDRVTDVEFKVGSQLTSLIKAESERLRSLGVDIVVLSLHEDIEGYDTSLSNGYIDVCFEGHSHSKYVQTDSYGVYHVQAGGENKGISHVEIAFNTVNNKYKVTAAEVVSTSSYTHLPDDPETEAIEEKYADVINYAYATLGTVSKKQYSSTVEDIVAELYLRAGLEKWGDQYDIVLGGGFLKTRSPYDLAAGQVTYSQVLSLLPFDNQLVLCKISGKNLKNRFVNTSNTDYHNAYSDYGNSIKNKINTSQTYYVVVDMYTAVYSPNGLTIVDYYDDGIYARDLLAAEIMAGRFA